MRDLVAIVRKELWEVAGDWHSFYGVAIQGLIVVALCGVMVPADEGAVWSSPGALVCMFGVFPSVLAATFAADSFAGERERKTLETLLASPVSDTAVFAGKALTALLVAVGCALATLAAAWITTRAKGGDPLPELGATGLLGVLGAGLSFALDTTAIATAVSMRVRVARAAQQISSMATIVLSLLGAMVMDRAHLPLTWPTLLRLEGGLVVLGLALLGVGLSAFAKLRSPH